MTPSEPGTDPPDTVLTGSTARLILRGTVELQGRRWCRDEGRGASTQRRVRLRPQRRRRRVVGIASNILADRLVKLVAAGLLTKRPSPEHRQKIDYRLTEAAIELVPVFAHLGAWGARWLPTAPELMIRAQLLERGGPEMWARFMDELRDTHLDNQPQADDGVLAELTAAYQDLADH